MKYYFVSYVGTNRVGTMYDSRWVFCSQVIDLVKFREETMSVCELTQMTVLYFAEVSAEVFAVNVPSVGT